MVEWLPNGRGKTQRILLIFLPNDPRTFLNVTCYRKWRVTAAMICWLLHYGATDQNLQKSQWVIASAGLAGTRIDWPKQFWQIGTYGKSKQCFQHHQSSIHKLAPPDVVNIATSTSSMKKSMGGACEENLDWCFLDANLGLLGWTPCRWRHWVTWACESKG